VPFTVSRAELEILARYDGFETVDEFEEWFERYERDEKLVAIVWDDFEATNAGGTPAPQK
jgi:hypothetical protein